MATSTRTRKAVERPDHVVVGYMNFDIEFLDNDDWAMNNEDDDMTGITRHVAGNIRIRVGPDFSEQHLRETLLHEVLHAVWSTSGLNQNHKHFDDDDREEEIITMQSPLLLHVLQQNPQLVAWLMA